MRVKFTGDDNEVTHSHLGNFKGRTRYGLPSDVARLDLYSSSGQRHAISW